MKQEASCSDGQDDATCATHQRVFTHWGGQGRKGRWPGPFPSRVSGGPSDTGCDLALASSTRTKGLSKGLAKALTPAPEGHPASDHPQSGSVKLSRPPRVPA